MPQVVPTVLGTVRTGILEGLASGTSWDVPSSPGPCWDHVGQSVAIPDIYAKVWASSITEYATLLTR